MAIQRNEMLHDRLLGELATSKKEIVELTTQLTALEESNKGLIATLALRKEALMKARADLDQQHQAKLELDAIKVQLGKEQRKYARLLEEGEKLQKENAIFNEKSGQQLKEQEILKRQIVSGQEKTTSLEERLREARKENTNMKADSKKMLERIEGLEGLVKRQEKEIGQLRVQQAATPDKIPPESVRVTSRQAIQRIRPKAVKQRVQSGKLEALEEEIASLKEEKQNSMKNFYMLLVLAVMGLTTNVVWMFRARRDSCVDSYREPRLGLTYGDERLVSIPGEGSSENREEGEFAGPTFFSRNVLSSPLSSTPEQYRWRAKYGVDVEDSDLSSDMKLQK